MQKEPSLGDVVCPGAFVGYLVGSRVNAVGSINAAHNGERLNGFALCTDEGFFGHDEFLTVQSTDPSESMTRRAAESIRLLNSTEVVGKWASWANSDNQQP